MTWSWRLAQSSALPVCLLGLVVLGCTERQTPAPVRALQRSGRVTFVCRAPDGSGRERAHCPDFAHREDDERENSLLALVTQTVTGEVAVVDLTSQNVVDVDPSIPGFTFLHVGAQPGAIVTTPGGGASFVGIGEIGREGVFALPTSCLRAPQETEDSSLEPSLDLTTWPACSLPSAPGEMAVLVDAASEDGAIRASCGAEPTAELPVPAAAERSHCPADLTSEPGPQGRRKLVVAMPELGELWVLDAQALLDRAPGSYGACEPEVRVALRATLPVGGVEQVLPDDLSEPGCVPSTVVHPLSPNAFTSRPAGFALGEGVLYVADQGAPLIHVLDVRDPCAPVEQPALLPVQLDQPERVATVSRIALSPMTSRGDRFLYAIDEQYQPSASVMVFDVGPGAARTPLVRSGSVLLPFEPADRIDFSAAARDVVFVQRNLEIADELGRVTSGTRCNPDPRIDPASPEARHRPSSDLRQGAGPTNLRGTFALVLLTNGQVAVIDVDDLDSDCRRPTRTNPAPELDFRGCAGDPADVPFFTDDLGETGRATVSNEASCRTVLPHRARSQFFTTARTDTGVRAPSLRSFPSLSDGSRGQPSGQSPEGRLRPRMLAVPFEDPTGAQTGIPPEVFIGTTRFRASSGDPDERLDNLLVLEPSEAELLSVALPFVEPRAYPRDEEVTVAYEGALAGERSGGLLRLGEGDTLDDADGRFCSRGTEDVALKRQVGAERFGLEGEDLDAFAVAHADYVQITAELVDEDDSYWSDGRGATCGGQGRSACEAIFGPGDLDDLANTRELRILQAFQDHVVVEPRNAESAAERAELAELMDCCFPAGAAYVVRASRQWVVRGTASGFRHRVVADPVTGRCGFDCNPRKRFFEGRAFEIVTNSCPDEDADGEVDCAVGDRTSNDTVCVYDATTGGVVPGGPASECIFDSLTARFAVYRGRAASRRGLVFRYQTAGGFVPLSFGLTRNTTQVLPEQIRFLPELGQIAIVDTQDLGLSLMSLDTFDFASGSPFF
ncbi:MAG TPA: hypothetical protein VF989_16450 [Polyangiaceae bacterium]